jgi:hypothetical protein
MFPSINIVYGAKMKAAPFESDMYKTWLSKRPLKIQAMAAEFPMATPLDVKGIKHWIIGYNEGDMLILSPIDPNLDYDDSVEQKIYACASHFRK